MTRRIGNVVSQLDKSVFIVIALLAGIRSLNVKAAWLPTSNVPTPRTIHPFVRSTSSSLSAQDSKTSQSDKERINRIGALNEWCNQIGIQISKDIQLGQDPALAPMGGLGWFARIGLSPSSSLLMTVPTDVALIVDAPNGNGPDDRDVIQNIEPSKQENFKAWPWYVQMALYLYKLDRISDVKSNVKKSKNGNMRPWLDVLPRSFNTPLHWDEASLQELQYPYLIRSVQRQEKQWRNYHEHVVQAWDASSSSSTSPPTWEEFVWGCECARSRVFSSSFSGNAFNPRIYIFTLVLILWYVGLNIGTIEQAANGAAFAVSLSILRDFVFPKLFSGKSKRYVLCPMIDMANHKSNSYQGEVNFEYFGNAYSLALTSTKDTNPVKAGDEIYISYGSRSNDQLLQYYGFVENNNPNDVYIMPPLREWDISTLEKASGRTFAAGRLQKLDRAGLLGVSDSEKESGVADDDTMTLDNPSDEAFNRSGGVVVTRTGGIDPAILQALRVLVSTDEEWESAGQSIGNFAEPFSDDNERCVGLVAISALQQELQSMATSKDQDTKLLEENTVDMFNKLALQFRIEKKLLLEECINRLR